MLIVKIGGGNEINWDGICSDLNVINKEQKVVLVHGASKKRDDIAFKLGIPTKYITAPSGHKGVYTDKKALDVLTMVYAGLVNKSVVARLQKAGINAVGLSGADGRVWEGKRKKNILSKENGKTKLIRETFTGKVEQVNSDIINLLLKNDYFPVITQPAISFEGELINTDNDRNLAVLSRDLGVKELVVLFEAPGLLVDPDDESSVIQQVKKDELNRVMKQLDGRMRKKVLGAIEAFDSGVEKIYWSDSRINNPITSALSGAGTVIK